MKHTDHALVAGLKFARTFARKRIILAKSANRLLIRASISGLFVQWPPKIGAKTQDDISKGSKDGFDDLMDCRQKHADGCQRADTKTASALFSGGVIPPRIDNASDRPDQAHDRREFVADPDGAKP